jgi:NADPH:quinone reductase-like Zn-dependent oxidoreductase
MKSIPETMTAVLLTGHGGIDKLDYRQDVAVPTPKADEVLIKVAAAGINNTDINTRTAWYSKTVTSGTNVGGAEGFSDINQQDAAWSGSAINFPIIQGADICGTIVSVGTDVDNSRIGEKVLVRTMQRHRVDYRPYECWTVGSESNGGFAQYTTQPSAEAFVINSDGQDSELASIPCAYSTAENLLHRAHVGQDTDTQQVILITGASGGVGSAAVQLAKRRGVKVIAIAAANKAQDISALGADQVIDRDADLIAELGEESIDIIIDIVAGKQWPTFLQLLKRGGKYATAGAIAGPIVELDVRTLYLKDLSLIGCTFQEDIVFHNLIRYIENHEIIPVVAKTYPLADIAQAQSDFLAKKYPGKLVLLPPQ